MGTPAQRAFVARVLGGARREEWRNHVVRADDGSSLCRIHDLSSAHRREGGGSDAALFEADVDGEGAFVKVRGVVGVTPRLTLRRGAPVRLLPMHPEPHLAARCEPHLT